MATLFSTPQKTDEWLVAHEMKTLAKSSHEAISPVYKSLQSAWEKAKENNANTFTAEGITIPTDKAGIFQSGTRETFCLHKNMVALFATPQKTDEWLVAYEMAPLAKSSHKTISPVYESLQSAWEKAKENNAASFTAEGMTIPTAKAGVFQSGHKKAFCLHKDIVDTIREIIDTQRAAKKSGNFTDMVGVHKSIAPDGPHITNRTGRVRTVAED